VGCGSSNDRPRSALRGCQPCNSDASRCGLANCFIGGPASSAPRRGARVPFLFSYMEPYTGTIGIQSKTTSKNPAVDSTSAHSAKLTTQRPRLETLRRCIRCAPRAPSRSARRRRPFPPRPRRQHHHLAHIHTQPVGHGLVQSDNRDHARRRVPHPAVVMSITTTPLLTHGANEYLCQRHTTESLAGMSGRSMTAASRSTVSVLTWMLKPPPTETLPPTGTLVAPLSLRPNKA